MRYAIEVDNLPTYVDYVRTYPNSPYTPRVWAIIRARREALVWRDALLTNSPDAYWTYLERYPDGHVLPSMHGVACDGFPPATGRRPAGA